MNEKLYKRIVIYTTFLLFVSFYGFAQTDSSFLKRSYNAIEKYASDNPIEKVHLHCDKYSYSPGDTIWFKAYVVVGQNHKLSAISNVLHVELLTDKDSVCSKITLPIVSGLTFGDFPLSILSNQGTYHIRAYTNWMRNSGPDFFYDQSIFIKDFQNKETAKKQAKSKEPEVQFFPESGFLVNGLRSKVAVKAINNNGLGEDIAGSIVDEDGKDVTVFSTQHLGMGAFAFTPQPGKAYKAKISSKTGNPFYVKLPKAQDNGFAITVNNSDTARLFVRVAASGKLLESKKDNTYYLVGQTGGKIYYTAYFKLSDPTFSIEIENKRFPTGILQLTLFAADGEPLNERSVFIQHTDQLKLNLSAGKFNYSPRQPVSISIKGADTGNKPVVGSFSASVINEDFVGSQTSGNTILANLLLTSEIKGYIENPNYYFESPDTQTAAALDLVMLTQGYQRYDWKQILDNKVTPVYQPEHALELSGYLKTFGGKALAKSKVSLFTTQAGGQWMDTLTNEQGRFTFTDLIPDTTVKYSVQGRTTKDKKSLEVSLDTIAAFKTRTKYSFWVGQAPENEQSVYQKQIVQQLQIGLDRRIIPLKEVTIKATKAPLSGTWHADQVLRDFPEKYAWQPLSLYLTPRINGVIFQSGLPYSVRYPEAPMNIILDGFKIENEVFATLNLGDVEGVEVLRTSGNRDIITGMGNVLILTSKKYSGKRRIYLPDIITYQSNGFYKAKEFYLPKYNVPETSLNKPDLRTTIYWNPNIITDKNGSATFSFFNAETKGTYRVIVEGIDDDGNLGHQTYTYKVE